MKFFKITAVSIFSFVFLLTSVNFNKTLAIDSFKTGWWIDRDQTTSSKVATYASEGNTLVLLAGWLTSTSQIQSTLSYLNTANQNGIKMIVGLEGGATPTMNVNDFTTVVNSLKSHPALWGYYIGDEPELTNDQNLIQQRHNMLLTSPGYYPLLKRLDPAHPVVISFNQPYNEQQWVNQSVFYDTTDVIGIHSYPFWSTGGEFGTGEGRGVYDIWKRGLTTAKDRGKDFIATGMGFGNNSGSPYRNPTQAEIRYQVFTAMVLGVDKILFWIDSWGVRSGMTDLIKNTIAQIHDIGDQMNSGVTNDPTVSVSVTDRNQLVYRYGSANGSTVLLAVNIANRNSSSGLALSNVRFILPSTVTAANVTVAGENRTIPVTNHSFSDNFAPFQVHAYKFGGTGGVVQLIGDVNSDGRVNIIDIGIIIDNYGRSPILNTKADVNTDGRVDIIDIGLTIDHFQF